ncbi:hypothetical protein ACFW2V_12625 [Streptomyces sp. NPDC058947]|uniref:hypothetical protein n=1 Tax=Streptomyces sp. NPDC058947 TaxID=3346675 RepID=UPI00369E586F
MAVTQMDTSPTVYEIVNGPREERGDTIDRALVANVALAREAALLRDADAESDYHEGINDLLDLRLVRNANAPVEPEGE